MKLQKNTECPAELLKTIIFQNTIGKEQLNTVSSILYKHLLNQRYLGYSRCSWYITAFVRDQNDFRKIF